MKRCSKLALPYVVWAALMLVLPMLLIALYSVMEQGNSIISFSFTLDHYVKFFTDPDFLLILWRSIAIAAKTTLICLLLGYPAAYFISKCSEKAQNVLILCITLPMWINMLVRTYAWIGILSEGGILQRILGLFGLGDMELLYTEGSVLLGMVYNFLPFMILQVHTSLTKMDHSLLEASADLGGRPGTDFSQSDAPAVPAGSDQRDHFSVPACGQLLLYPEAAGRRTIFPDRKYDREPVYHSGRVELRKRDLHDHRGHHDAADDGGAQDRTA